jgi:AraC family transcriptional regulator of adaptative response / DNA-3-methyladenine glycosylase II
VTTSAVSAVVNTGIYCVPGCRARPRPENVRPYASAAAAEAAGYRACLRCRPYREAEALGAVGPELVCRAVTLILAGVLDGGDESTLATRLGVSARHLRRLFVEHAGVTPDQLARSRRAHFARRLLDDTDLSFTDVAFASGFGSVRQFNRACRQVFRATPGELRARRRAADRLVADGGIVLRLPFRGPLDWEAMLAYHSVRAIAGVEAVADGVYRRTVVVGGDPGVVELWRGGDDHLLMRAHLPHWDGLIHVVDRARRIFALDLDPGDAYRHLAGDRLIGPRLPAHAGLRPPGTWDPFETGMRAIIGQQVTVPGAGTITGRLVRRVGTPVPGLAPLRLTHAFPSPVTVADADLDGLGLTTTRAAAVRAYAAAVAAGDIRLDRSVGLDRVVESIVGVAGLGPWTAHYLALRMGEADAFPSADLGLRRAAGDGGPPMPAAELEALSDAWRPWRAYAAVHLWTGVSASPSPSSAGGRRRARATSSPTTGPLPASAVLQGA